MITAASEKLILCSGPYVYSGFKTLDCNPDYQPDFCVVLPPFPRELRHGRWSEIYLIHGIEHFYRWEAEELIPQLYEALAPDGLLVLEQPNIEVAMKVALGLMESPTVKPEASGMQAIYGDPGYENPWMCHKWGWTPATLTTLVVQSGFNPSRIRTGQGLSRSFAGPRDFRLEAIK